jgi:hypothetical protein
MVGRRKNMNNHGMPIYLDDVPRNISDITAETDSSRHVWEPSNKAAHKLYRCVEALRDIHSILEDAASSQSKDKRRREIKIMFTPLVSLAQGIVDLLNYAECDSEACRRIGSQMHGLIPQLRERFLQYVPLERKKLLSTLRNKVSAHVDESLFPAQSRDLLSKARLNEVGLWLHVSIAVMLDLIKLPMYAWMCDCDEKGFVRLMTNEPFLLTITCEKEKPENIVGLHIVQDTPTKQIWNLMDKVIQASRWMFEEQDTRVVGLVEHREQRPWPESIVHFPKKGESV